MVSLWPLSAGRELRVRIRYANMTIQQFETSAPPTSRKPPAITAYLVRA